MRPDVVLRSIIMVIVALLLPLSVSAQTLADAQKSYNAAVTANGEGNVEEAISQFNTCIETCEYLVEEEEDEEAEELMYKVQAVVPRLYLQLGTNQLKNKQIKEGLDNLYKGKEVAGNYGDKESLEKANQLIPKVHYTLGGSKMKSGDLDGAITELDKAIKANADYAKAYYLKTAVYKQKGDDDAIAATAKLGIAASKRDKDMKTGSKISELAEKHFLLKGNEAKGASKLEDAVNYLNNSLEFNPVNPTTLYLLAQTYSAQKKYAECISTAKTAVENENGSDEDKAKIYMLIAESQTSLGKNTEACASYKKAAVGAYEELATYKIKHELKCE